MVGGEGEGGARRELSLTGLMACRGFYPGNLHVNFSAHVQNEFPTGEESDSSRGLRWKGERAWESPCKNK